MDKKLFYTALFHKAEEGGFWVSFPDIPECLTEGDDMGQAYAMAVDALGLVLSEKEAAGEQFPTPSMPDELAAEDDAYAVIVEFDMLEYKKKTASQAVKKTLSIPSWLNEEAMARGINFSSVLQDALKERLGIQ